MANLTTTDPTYVDGAGSLVELQKSRLMDYATTFGSYLWDAYSELQHKRSMDYAHVQTDVSFPSTPNNEVIKTVYEIFGDAQNQKLRFIDVFIQVGSWTWLKFSIKEDDSNVDANGEEKPVQSELPVHDESSDQRV